MSKKSASMARRLFAAVPHGPVPSVNGPVPPVPGPVPPVPGPVRTHLCVRSEQSSPAMKGVY